MAVSITKHQWLFDSSLRKTLYKNCTEKCCLFKLSPFVVAGLLLGIKQFHFFDAGLSTKVDRYAPIILGIILFLAFEALMLGIRMLDPVADTEPPIER